jgi:hypothetical protein
VPKSSAPSRTARIPAANDDPIAGSRCPGFAPSPPSHQARGESRLANYANRFLTPHDPAAKHAGENKHSQQVPDILAT